VVILLTDGMNNAGTIQPLDAAQIAGELGIRTYTMGVGTNGKALSARGHLPQRPVQVRLCGCGDR
jgi:Ca-activated chloride channel family protein